jgi:hypothetical protein
VHVRHAPSGGCTELRELPDREAGAALSLEENPEEPLKQREVAEVGQHRDMAIPDDACVHERMDLAFDLVELEWALVAVLLRIGDVDRRRREGELDHEPEWMEHRIRGPLIPGE